MKKTRLVICLSMALIMLLAMPMLVSGSNGDVVHVCRVYNCSSCVLVPVPPIGDLPVDMPNFPISCGLGDVGIMCRMYGCARCSPSVLPPIGEIPQGVTPEVPVINCAPPTGMHNGGLCRMMNCPYCTPIATLPTLVSVIVPKLEITPLSFCLS